jgi:hypothetical protein
VSDGMLGDHTFDASLFTFALSPLAPSHLAPSHLVPRTVARTADVLAPSLEYTPRAPGRSVLYQNVREHFETFRADAAHLRDGEGLPRFVEEEFLPGASPTGSWRDSARPR